MCSPHSGQYTAKQSVVFTARRIIRPRDQFRDAPEVIRDALFHRRSDSKRFVHPAVKDNHDPSLPPDRLRLLRRRAMLSQREVERLTGISDATIAYLESGRHRPQLRTLAKLLFLYDLNIRRLEQYEQTWRTPEDRAEIPKDLWRRR